MQRVKRIPVIIGPPLWLLSNRGNGKIRPPLALGDDVAFFAGSQNVWQFDHGQKTTGRKYHRPFARDRAWIAFVWTFMEKAAPRLIEARPRF
jgi:hypothetical protein